LQSLNDQGGFIDMEEAVMVERSHPFDAWMASRALVGAVADYWRDACERSILFLDVLRERGNNHLERSRQAAPHVLNFAGELIMDGRTLPRPVNYGLVRIVQPEGMRTSASGRSSSSTHAPATARGSAVPSQNLIRTNCGGLERLAIACLHGDADQRSAAACPQRTPNPYRAGVGIDRPAPSNCCARAQRHASSLLSFSGSTVLALAYAVVVGLAGQPGDRSAGDGLALAP
jgi:hypothetical protein